MSSLPPLRPSRPPNPRGFSLVLSLTVMAMLLILCLGAAALLSVELRVAQASAAMARARFNAMVGARISLGEIQRLLGPDQRVSATADILTASSPDTVTVAGDGTMSPKPTEAAYYSGPDGVVAHPRWVGVWNSGLMTTGTPVSQGGGPAEGESGKVIQRANDGSLYDSRFPATGSKNTWRGSGPATGRLDSGAAGRLMGWLVSGNEALPAGSAMLNPITTAADASKDVVLLGRGTLGKNFDPADRSGDRLGARARRVAFTDTAGNTAGGYAFWVSDEGVKARLNVVDRFGATSQPQPGSPLSDGYFRMLTSQRDRFAIVRDPDNAESLAPVDNLTAEKIGRISSFDDIAQIAGGGLSGDTLRANWFNDITFVSRGVLSDAVNGGLKKDMTAYLKGMGTGAGDFAGVKDADPIPDTPNLKGLYPNYGYIRNWISNAPAYADTAAPEILPPQTTETVPPMLYASVDYSTGAAPVLPARTPLVTQFELYFVLGKHADPLDGVTKCGFATAPVVTIWNPYPVALKLENYSVHAMYWAKISIGAGVTFNYGSMPTGSAPLMCYALPDVTIPPGRAMSFSAPAGVTVPPDTSWTITRASGRPRPAGKLVAYAPGANGWFFYPVRSQASVDAAADPAKTWRAAGDGYGFVNDPGSGALYSGGRFPPLAYRQLFLMSGGKTVQHVSLEPYSTKEYAGRVYYHTFNNDAYPLRDLSAYTPWQMDVPVPECLSFGWRLLGVDDPGWWNGGVGGNSDNPNNFVRNANFNLFVQNNFRASKFTRYPFDAQTQERAHKLVLGGVFQWDTNPVVFGAVRTSPLFVNTDRAPLQIAPADVPRKEWGLPSLAALQHCPMSMMQWMPAFAVGDAYASPVVDTAGSALGKDVEGDAWRQCIKAAWGGVGLEDGLPEYYSNYLAAKAKGGDTPLYFTDLSYELNRALYDAWFVSGAGMGASGGTDSGVGFDKGATWAPTKKNIANSRFSTTGKPVDCPSPLYAAAAGLMLDGAFNVNSTSQAAWEALFSSARGISVPAVSGTGTTGDRTPFPHLAKPLTGAIATAATAPYDDAAWAGYRVVTDDEIRVLAAHLVRLVKERGPFLGVADFVNRRLRAGLRDTPAAYWEFTGALQAAIDLTTRKNQMINTGLEPDGDTGDVALRSVQIARQADAATPARYTDPVTGVKNEGIFINLVPGPLYNNNSALPGCAENRVVSKAAGAPGYLTQADMLQHIGVALAARSDTFVIRSVGDDAATGARAAVEFTVQRIPEAVIPYERDRNGSCVPTFSKTTGQQLFGRRFVVTRTRWLALDDL